MDEASKAAEIYLPICTQRT